MRLDTLIFGGGAAGLWLLDELVRRGRSALLLEARALGSGQTVASQGIIHGGLKYTLSGALTRSAAAIRDMPAVWRECLDGSREPRLTGTRLRSACCYLWRTRSLASRLGMIGARFGLRVTPQRLQAAELPAVLAACPGTVARLDERVIDPRSFLADLAGRHGQRLLKIDAEHGLALETSEPGRVRTVRLSDEAGNRELCLEPRRVVFAAGAGNQELRRRAGLSPEAMQRRPLHMVLVRGPLPELHGHCVDGSRTRVTVTSDSDGAGRTVWQVGGQIAEDGVTMSRDELVRYAASELSTVLPALDLSGTEWTTYRVDRAEGTTPTGGRPDHVQVIEEGNVLTAWPTKLALVPELARVLLERIEVGDATTFDESPEIGMPADWPPPEIALPPWEAADPWLPSAGLSSNDGVSAA
ncbi:MAG: FAD-dependent oxidoreductase [Planctomycetes bacterium]|nr:FAD-dependent oxidoreductase [Planctomycetota bacterium]